MDPLEHDRIAQNARDIALVAQDVRRLDEKVNVFAPVAAQLVGVGVDVDDLKGDVRDMGDRLTRHMTELHGAVERLRADMNGRLRALELWRAGLQAIGRSVRWLPTLLGAVVGGTTTGLLVWIFTH